jgi:hypothetical protein
MCTVPSASGFFPSQTISTSTESSSRCSLYVTFPIFSFMKLMLIYRNSLALQFLLSSLS